MPYYLPISGGRIIGFIPFPRVLVLCEMHSASSKIWTRVAVSISYDDNHYTTGTSQYTLPILPELEVDNQMQFSVILEHLTLSIVLIPLQRIRSVHNMYGQLAKSRSTRWYQLFVKPFRHGEERMTVEWINFLKWSHGWPRMAPWESNKVWDNLILNIRLCLFVPIIMCVCPYEWGEITFVF